MHDRDAASYHGFKKEGHLHIKDQSERLFGEFNIVYLATTAYVDRYVG